MWAAATSGTRYASQHHIQDEVHLSKGNFAICGSISEASFVFIGTRTLERKRSRRVSARVCR